MSMSSPVPTGYRPAPGPSNVTQRPLLRRWFVIGTVVLLFLGGAAVLSAVFGAEFGVQSTLTALVAALLPVAIVVPAFLWLDRAEAEPVTSLLVAFGWGALVATSSSLVVNSLTAAVIGGLGLDGELLGSVFVAPVVEECAKGIGVLAVLLIRRDEFDGVLDGVVYGGLVAAGFAFGENILYLAQALTDGGVEGFVSVLVLRGLMSPFAHPLFTVWTGIGIGVLVTGRSVFRVLAPPGGLLLAMTLHAMWNGGASLGVGGWIGTYVLIQVPVFVATVAFVLGARRREDALVGRHLQHYAALGIYDQADVTMLSSSAGRRAARRWARGAGGRRGLTIMRDFQDDSVELAFLRARAVRRPSSALVEEEHRLVDSVIRARGAFRPTAIRPSTL